MCLTEGRGKQFLKAVIRWKELLIPDQIDPDTNKVPEGDAGSPYPESSAPSCGSGIRSQLNK